MSLISSIFPCPGSIRTNAQVTDYILEKVLGHNIVLMGITHKQPAILKLIIQLLPYLKSYGVTHLALEIDSRQQRQLQHFLTTGQGLDKIQLSPAIDCPDYRHLLSELHQIHPSRRPEVVAIDLPEDLYDGPICRNAYMAENLLAVSTTTGSTARILAVLGSLHVLRCLPWQDRIQNGYPAVRTYLEQRQPQIQIFSIVHIMGNSADNCDFSQRLGGLPGLLAMDVDDCFNGWRLGITSGLALRPTEPHEMVDGVIIHS